MVDKILAAADIPAKPARFSDPPDLHAVYFDSMEADGPDFGPATSVVHNCTVELYTPSISAGNDAMLKLQAELCARSIRFTTQGWYWLSAIQRYQEIIEFTYFKKLTGGKNNEI